MQDHLLETMDFAREMKTRGEGIYVASVDVDGAFDTVPHGKLLNSLKAVGVDSFLLRYVATWLSRRKFSVCLSTPNGRYFSYWRNLSRGLPQGAVLSPF